MTIDRRFFLLGSAAAMLSACSSENWNEIVKINAGKFQAYAFNLNSTANVKAYVEVVDGSPVIAAIVNANDRSNIDGFPQNFRYVNQLISNNTFRDTLEDRIKAGRYAVLIAPTENRHSTVKFIMHSGVI